MNILKVAIVQMTSTDVIESNIKQLEDLLPKARSADLIVLPENSMFFRIRAGSQIQGLEAKHIVAIEKLVATTSSSLMLTTSMPSNVRDKFLNSTLLFEPGQKAQVVYSKIHLFDVDVDGAPSVRESEVFDSGQVPSLVDFRGWKLGLSVCYDLRFAELYLNYAQKADVIFVPSAFLVPTGQAHWHVLLRARAIENQCYVVAPAQAGEHSAGGQIRRTYGHSLAVDPWGRVIGELDLEPGVLLVELSRSEIDKARKQIPMSKHRRLALW